MNLKAPPIRRPGSPLQRGFTLLEIALAIAMTIGLLFVVLFFYNQMSTLRQGLLQETDRITAARQVLNRITMELRTARVHDILVIGLTGTSNSLEFIRTCLPSPSSWNLDDLGRSRGPESDLRIVSYGLAGSGDPARATGLVRGEVPVLESDFYLSEDESAGTSDSDLIATVPHPSPQLLTEHLRYLQFRYWDGASWQESWSRLVLPLGIEVTLGAEPLPEEAPEEGSPWEYPFEVFRRIIYLPASQQADETATFLDLLNEAFPLE